MTDPDERVRRYLRARGDVPVPGDLHWPATGNAGRSRSRWTPWVAVAATAAAAVLFGGVLFGVLPPAGGDHNGSPVPTAPAERPSQQLLGGFPSEVAGIPVVSVAEASDLLQRGALDGRDVAVAGYYFELVMSCPALIRYVGPLESWCHVTTLAGSVADATLCTSSGNSVACGMPSGTHLEPFFVLETSGSVPNRPDRAPSPVVLIGHADDPRQWQCEPDAQAACRRAFVVDRVAWANGADVPLTAPPVWDELGQTHLVPRMSAADAAAVAAPGRDPVAAAPFEARAIASVDPRWNLAGSELVWVVRSVDDASANADPARAVTVTLVNDATGDVIGARPLADDAAFRPARLWVAATMPISGQGCCNAEGYFSVAAAGGAQLYDGRIQGGSWGTDSEVTFGPGPPLVLDPGTVSVAVWLSSADPGASNPPIGGCSTEVALGELDAALLTAVYPPDGSACTFGPLTPPPQSPGG